MSAIKKSAGEKIFEGIIYIALTLFALATLYPFVNMLAISFSSGTAAASNQSMIIPHSFTLENYQAALNYPAIGKAAVVSVLRVVIGTFVKIMVTSMAAYAYSKKDLLFRNFLAVFFMIPLFVNPGLSPAYLNYRNLHMLDNFAIYVIPSAFAFFDFVMIRTYIDGIPISLEESAFIDGAGYPRIFIQIVMPMAKPVIAAVTLFTAVSLWNEWFSSMVYVITPEKRTMSYTLQRILQEELSKEMLKNSSAMMGMTDEDELVQTTATTIRMAVIAITTLPIVCVYPFVQKYFAQGMLIGSVKG